MAYIEDFEESPEESSEAYRAYLRAAAQKIIQVLAKVAPASSYHAVLDEVKVCLAER